MYLEIVFQNYTEGYQQFFSEPHCTLHSSTVMILKHSFFQFPFVLPHNLSKRNGRTKRNGRARRNTYFWRCSSFKLILGLNYRFSKVDSLQKYISCLTKAIWDTCIEFSLVFSTLTSNSPRLFFVDSYNYQQPSWKIATVQSHGCPFVFVISNSHDSSSLNNQATRLIHGHSRPLNQDQSLEYHFKCL